MRFPSYKRPPVKVVRKQKEKPDYRCRDCSHHYGDYEKGYDGKPFLCHCDLGEAAPVKRKTDYNKFYKFLNDEACEKFNKQTTN